MSDSGPIKEAYAAVPPVGRFAPSPTGRMHLGNVYAALMSWLSVRSRGGRWVLRIEDLDPQRSRPEYARLIEDDLHWLGLDWDEGGIDGTGPGGPYCQSLRAGYYEEALRRLRELGVVYGCTCTRADLHAAGAPHLSDAPAVYGRRCCPAVMPSAAPLPPVGCALRFWAGAADEPPVEFADAVCGAQSFITALNPGDPVIRRRDGAWGYQLAVTVDDMAMGITEVVRGDDLLPSAALQTRLHRLLGGEPPRWGHLPLLRNAAGQRLAKRDASLSMEALRASHTPAEVTGMIAHLAGLRPEAAPCRPHELLAGFSLASLARNPHL